MYNVQLRGRVLQEIIGLRNLICKMQQAFYLRKRNFLHRAGLRGFDSRGLTVTLADAIDRANRKLSPSLHRRYFGETRDGGTVGCGRKNWFRGILRAILGRVHTKTCSDECTPSSSRRVPRVISKEDGIRKRGRSIESDRERFYGGKEGKGVEEGERAETLTLLRETLPEHSYMACNEQTEKQ